jgi:predicted nucleic acid-binding protein
VLTVTDAEVTAPPRVILDTNVLVAAGFRGASAAGRLVEAVRRGDFRLVWNEETRRENEAVLRRIPRLDWEEFRGLFDPAGEYRGETRLDRFSRIEDPEDRKFAALAAAAGAVVVSADAHLLSCRDDLPIVVLTARELLTMTGSRQSPAA